jgi:uncharacterized iron-regulated protein
VTTPEGGHKLSVFVLVLATALIASGLSTASASDPRPLIIDMLMGEPVPMEMMLEDLVTVRIVYIGEIHSIARHHAVQAELLRLLADRDTKPALGMEMFSQEQQPVLDRWQQGKDDVGQLIRDLGQEHWTNLKDYESVLVLARDRGIPIAGLTASDDLVRKVSRGGVASLTESERRMLPPGYDTINESSERLLRLRLRVHRAFQEKGLENVLVAQSIRDASMAQAVVRFLGSQKGQDRLMVVIAGAGHVHYGFGIPDRVKSHIDVPYRIVLITESGELVLSEAEKRQSVPVHITHEDLRFIRSPIADYLHVTPLQALEAHPRDQPAKPNKR